MPPLEWQTDHFIWTTSCEAVRSNKFWTKKIHRWFRSHSHLFSLDWMVSHSDVSSCTCFHHSSLFCLSIKFVLVLM